MTERRRRPLTPHEIRGMQIRRIGLRKGYDPAAVHELLHRLAEETATREHTIGELTNRLSRAETEAYARRHGTLPADPDLARIEDQLVEIDVKLKAQQYADEMIASAQQGAAQIVEQSKQQANQVLTDAHRAAEQAAHAYRARAGTDYNPDREELERLLGLARWAQRQLAGLHQQITATNTTVSKELDSLIARLRPAVEAEPPAAPHPGRPDSAAPYPTAPRSPAPHPLAPGPHPAAPPYPTAPPTGAAPPSAWHT